MQRRSSADLQLLAFLRNSKSSATKHTSTVIDHSPPVIIADAPNSVLSPSPSKVHEPEKKWQGVAHDDGNGPVQKRSKNMDWLSENYSNSLTPFQQELLNVDWFKSPLGPVETWPLQLRQMVLLVNKDPSPACIIWGDKNAIVYNEPYTHLIGDKHPKLLGMDLSIEFGEIWEFLDNLFTNLRTNEVAELDNNTQLLLYRRGFLEETYFSWKFVPVTGPEGDYVAAHATVVEATREVLSERRLSTVHELSSQLSDSKSVKDLWAGIIDGLRTNPKDVPLALLYSVADLEEAKKTRIRGSSSPSGICILEGQIGIPEGHELAPIRVDLENEKDQSVIVKLLRKAAEQVNPLVISLRDDEICSTLLLEELPWESWDTPPNTLIICQIQNLAFLCIGLNPRRPLDQEYKNFISQVTEQITKPHLSAIILREEVIKRARIAEDDAIDKDRLSRELSLTEERFSGVINRAPIGLAFMTVEGDVLSANDLWKTLTQLNIGSGRVQWDSVLWPGESEVALKLWEKMVTEKTPLSCQAKMAKRILAPQLDDDGKPIEMNAHVLVNWYPSLDKNGNVTNVLSCITDISHLKWSEEQLRARMNDAISLKKQQEKFIDMTSHEMRNPLSALIGCADEIVRAINECRPAIKDADDSATLIELLDEAGSAAETIIYCAMHQKRIIDDILTLSKLDSNLMKVSPESSTPVELFRSIIKIFDSEAKRANIELDFVEQKSLSNLSVDWLLFDPSRVIQVFINLMTNAIKFTRTETHRNIQVTVGASLKIPSDANQFGVVFVKKSQESASLDQTEDAAWGDGEIIYLSIAVTDSGRGLDQTEIGKLFSLFQQASPKTHVTYGGSGLGLFISRQLVEVQGGQIGVSSQGRGKGATFQFYIKTRRASKPAVPESIPGQDYQLLMRDQALQEACGVQLPVSHDVKSSYQTQDNVTSIQSPLKNEARQESQLGVFPNPVEEHKQPLHILIVEDNQVNQRVLSKQLRKKGYGISVADNGKEALHVISRSVFWSYLRRDDATTEQLSVVLMDLEMPVMDGITCVQRIRELQKSGEIRDHVPVIAVTANARTDQVAKCFEAGMDGVITKPYRIEQMVAEIEKMAARFELP